MRTVLIYSGGSDSFTLLHWLLEQRHTVLALSFNYEQRHKKELCAAMDECERLGVSHKVLSLPFMPLIARHSSQTGSVEVPEGFYANENMKRTVVPNRNMIMLSIATAYAIDNDCQVVAYGAHAGDHDIYPDCRKEFVQAMSTALSLCDSQPVALLVPFIDYNKRVIYRWGLHQGLDYSRTWTCYKGEELACGRCGSCVERLHAFKDLGVEDPLAYADREFYLEAIKQGAA